MEEDRRRDQPTGARAPRSAKPACAAAAARRIRPATSGAPRPRIAADERYVVANGFEADPGTRLDRTLMENDPHAIVEGLALAAYADRGALARYIAVARTSHPCQAASSRRAIRLAEEQGFIGSNALDDRRRCPYRGRRASRWHGRR